MANRRTISWSTAMRDLRGERARRAGVREERLRTTSGLRGAVSLSSWRGRSGRRYVVGVHALDEAEMLDVTDAVVIAVGRDGEGVGRVVAVAATGPVSRERARRNWVSAARARGATEMHIHRLADDDEGRRAVVEDLIESVDQPRPGVH